MNIEESNALHLDFNKFKNITSNNENILPVVVQDIETMNVLILAYVNQTALEKSISTKIATFWSTSRNELWVKGATSGQFLDLQEIRVNCEQNSLLFLVKIRSSGSCHTKKKNGDYRYSCFYRKLSGDKLIFLEGQE